MSLKEGAKVIFRRIGGRVIPIYQKHKVAVDAAAAAGTFIGASVIAEKSRNKVAEKLYYKGRKGFNSDIANFAWDTGVKAGVFYAAHQKFKPVQNGTATILKFLKTHLGRGF